MAGIFSKNNRPKLPGSYFNFAPEAAPAIQPNPGTAVAIPFLHDWGPFDTAVRVSSFAEFQQIYGNSDNTEGYRAVRQAFQGEGVDGRGGAGEVVCYRFGGTSAAKAVKTLQNTTPAAAITLTARYHGTKGNQLKVTTQDYAADSAYNELILYLDTVEVERYRYLDTDITDLAAQINASSNWVTAGSVTSGVALSAVSASSFASGDDGTTLLAADWTGAMSAFEIQPFAVFCPYHLVESSPFTIEASIVAWTKAQNLLGKRFFTVLGGGTTGDTLTLAKARSVAAASGDILNLGIGYVTNPGLGTGQTAYTLTLGEFAARVAGALAARGESRSMTYARFADCEMPVGPTLTEQSSAFDGGVVSLARDSHPVAPIHIATGLTTWTSANATADTSKPYYIFRQPKYVRTMHALQTELTEWAELNIVGQATVDQATRDALVAEAKVRLLGKQEKNAIQEGWTVGIDSDPPPSDDDEFIALAIGINFERALEQVYFSVSVG